MPEANTQGALIEAQRSFQDRLIHAGLLIPLGVRGLYARSGVFEGIVQGIESLVTREGAWQQAEVMRFPPLFARAHYQRLDHIANFPDLLGSVHCFFGDEREHRAMLAELEAGSDWAGHLRAGESMLVPAACYPLYPTASGSQLPAQGRVVDLETYVFRHEPSDDPARMQMFRQREFVRLGTAEQALEHRDRWLRIGLALLESLRLPVASVLANDPFFGRGGKVMKATQLEQELKYELVVPICSEEHPTAVTSCNCHLDHFGRHFDIHGPDEQPAHTSCVGFGLERITLALLKTHGLDTAAWPLPVRERLGLS
ncbi:amino acid--[acyl-carrier-protein] ligase [Thiomonas sp.]|uniref:amino acid--[acyl-carrier-protein] ligase n=1 Tax=Thiomonas sp. TaxID=2047785 RepID=UPI00262D8C34|nr:amino acid--[acyl-carrier-protein] ligase [Thiomonas sp.]